jgi:hypothetical protein
MVNIDINWRRMAKAKVNPGKKGGAVLLWLVPAMYVIGLFPNASTLQHE